MSRYRISEVAAASGVAPSTLRYYDRIGLVRPPARSPSGYRLYDDESVERLAFIGRAKRLGMTLDEVATLIEAWFDGECEPLQERLRVFVSGRIGELQRQIADESRFERQLQRILARLDATGTPPARCEPDCGCDTDPGADLVAGGFVCSLGRDDAARRIADWQRLLTQAVRAEHGDARARFVFDATPALGAEAARLCVAETECCPFFAFDLAFTANTVVLTIEGRPDDDGTVAAWFHGPVNAQSVGASSMSAPSMSPSSMSPSSRSEVH